MPRRRDGDVERQRGQGMRRALRAVESGLPHPADAHQPGRRTGPAGKNRDLFRRQQRLDGIVVHQHQCQINVTGLVDNQEQNWFLQFSARPARPCSRAPIRARPARSRGPRRSCRSSARTPARSSAAPSRSASSTIAADTTVTRLAIDFEQHCSSAGNPPLVGTIRYQSALDQRAVDPRQDVAVVLVDGDARQHDRQHDGGADHPAVRSRLAAASRGSSPRCRRARGSA